MEHFNSLKCSQVPLDHVENTYHHNINIEQIIILKISIFFLYIKSIIFWTLFKIFIGGDTASTGKMLAYSCMSRDSSNLVNHLGKLISADYGYVAAA